MKNQNKRVAWHPVILHFHIIILAAFIGALCLFGNEALKPVTHMETTVGKGIVVYAYLITYLSIAAFCISLKAKTPPLKAPSFLKTYW
ncbi:TPA: hypothetical protein I7730_20500 [Vibrio vulnificus]|uniref:Uncharacterized protein n=1 Tax=Vibrio vulnificus TaxID=672 RepID=A0A8H9N3M4_VIBVL|nr:hypothetical protein [Vibrio vulnificus]HAS8542173.1 hypothetical protein [Vibrio vulnificus]